MTTRTVTYMSGRLLLSLTTQPCTLPASSPRVSSSTLRRQPPSSSHLFTSTMTTNTNQDHLDALFKQKRLLRTQVRKALKSMDPLLRSQEDDAIQSLVLEAPWFKSSQRLCAYISCPTLREVDTSKVLAHILRGEDGVRRKLYVPRVEDKNSHMRMLHISSVDDMVANSMDILEPAAVDGDGNEREDVLQASDPVDLLILPGLAFDRSGRRLGRGGGYYDTFLSNYQELAKERNWKQPLLVALSYSPQIVDEGLIAVTERDVSVDALVTSAGVIPISTAAKDSDYGLPDLNADSFLLQIANPSQMDILFAQIQADLRSASPSSNPPSARSSPSPEDEVKVAAAKRLRISMERIALLKAAQPKKGPKADEEEEEEEGYPLEPANNPLTKVDHR